MKNRFIVLTSLLLISVGMSSSLAQWVQTNNFYGGYFRAIAASGTSVFAGGTANGFFASTNAGKSWMEMGLNKSITSIAVAHSNSTKINLFVGANLFDGVGGVILSSDNGQTWNQMNSGLNSLNVSALILYPKDTIGATLFAGIWDEGIYRSTDNGSSWIRSDSGMTEPMVRALAVTGNGKGTPSLLAATTGGIFFSTNKGQSWIRKDSGITQMDVHSLQVLYTGTDTTVLLAGAWNGNVFRSTDNGSSWLLSDSGLTFTTDIDGSWAEPLNCSFAVVPGTSGDAIVFLATNGGGIFLSSDNGTSWTAVNNGLTFPYVTSLAAVPDGNGGMNLFAGTWGDGVYLSSNSGSKWNPVDSGLAIRNVTTLATYPRLSGDTLLLAGTYGGGLFCSRDGGATWNRDNLGVTSVVVNALAGYLDEEGATRILLGGAGLFISTNEGASWNTFNISCNIRAFAVFNNDTGGTKILAGGLEWGIPNTGEVFLSADYGNNWSQIGTKINVQDLVALAAYDSLIFAGTPNGVFLSTDGCITWNRQNMGLTDTSVVAFTLSRTATGNTNIFACTRSGLFLSTDNGLSWTLAASDPVINQTNTLLEFRRNLFAGTSSGIWKRPLSELFTSVVPISQLQANTFNLKQNFPNPFNPSTTINYQLPMNSHVAIRIYDLLGREVVTLVDENEGAGYKSLKFDASSLPSGVYFYRLEAGTYQDTKKLLLLK